MRGEQRFYFSAQLFVARAGLSEERRTLVILKLKGRVIELANLLMTRRSHCLAPLNSRWSQALARLQSRLTVPSETLSTSAVSSMLKPPKKRSSTT